MSGLVVRAEACPVCPIGTQTVGCGSPVHHVDESGPGAGRCSCGAQCPPGRLISRWFDQHLLAAHEVATAPKVEVLAPTCGEVYPGPGDSSLRCRRDDGHQGSHQDGDKVWRSRGTVPNRDLPVVSPELLARCVTALHDEGAWCGDCDFESGPCEDCVTDLAGYALAVMSALGMTVPIGTVGLLPGTAEHGAYVRANGVIFDEAPAWAKASQEGRR